MMLKVGNDFLEFDEDVELERQALLFEELSETRGDYSYSFNIPRTHKNCGILGQPLPDNASKPVYTKIDCQLLSDSGSVLHIGFLRVEQLTKRNIITSFFSGNSNWLSLLTGDMTELNLSAYDVDMTVTDIEASWTANSGIVFPVIDTGVLIDRGYRQLMVEDFVGSFYLKTLFYELFAQAGIKITGEILSDPLYNKLIVVTNTRSKIDYDNNSLYVGKNDMQVVPDAVGNYVITFNLQSGGYYVGSDASFTTDTEFTAPYPMMVDITVQYRATDPRRGILFLNGVVMEEASGRVVDVFGAEETLSTVALKLETGDVVDFRMTRYDETTMDATVTYATMRIVPRFIYRAFGKSCVPLWTKLDFVNNILSMFNCITDYDPYSKTITIDYFKNIKSKTATDLSQYIDATEIEVDYAEFISNYGQRSLLIYQESDEEELADYNIGTFLKYGSGVINIENELISESSTLFESDLTAPISYVNPVFDASLERIHYVEYEDVYDRESSDVTDASGVARFNRDSGNNFTPFQVGEMVRIESTTTAYNGVWKITAANTNYIEVDGLDYIEDAKSTITRLRWKLTSDENVYLMVYVQDIDVADISQTREDYKLADTTETSIGYAYFNLINTNTQVNDDYTQGLSFGPVVDPLFYQRTLIETYWSTCARVLNDPVTIRVAAYLPESVYKSLTPLSPVYIRTEETTNLYYVNRTTGMKPCQIELIKLP